MLLQIITPPLSSLSPSSPPFIKPISTVRSTPLLPPMSAFESRVSLVLALASQTATRSQRVVADLVGEVGRYAAPRRRFESGSLEEALMIVPDLESVEFKVLRSRDRYEIREVEPYFIAETTMPGRGGFDFYGSSQSFNVLAEYLFGKNEVQEKMDMTTPVITRRNTISDGEKMELTTSVITKKSDEETWQMSFVMPSKFGANLPLPKDPSVRIKKVPKHILAVVAFSGFATDGEVAVRESKLRDDLKADVEFQIKGGAMVEVSQYNPPFTLPFTRRNEIALEVEWRKAIS